MAGITEIETLLKDMKPILSNESFIFASVNDQHKVLAHYTPWAIIREEEGATIILPTSVANEFAIEYEGEYQRITLTVHSSLQAVGLTAEIANALGNSGISANVVAGFYHDHIFVPKDKALQAMEALVRLSHR